MIQAGDIRKGVIFDDGTSTDPKKPSLFIVVDFQHVKPGKGAAILKTKMKNLKTGSTQERNFNASTKFDQANIEKKNAQFSYSDDSTLYFMDMQSYETYELAADILGDKKYFIVESMEVSLVFFEGAVLDVAIPEKVELTVTETTPAIKGAPTTQTKDAVTETGFTLRVPQFIEEGEKIVVSTSDGKYSGRA